MGTLRTKIAGLMALAAAASLGCGCGDSQVPATGTDAATTAGSDTSPGDATGPDEDTGATEPAAVDDGFFLAPSVCQAPTTLGSDPLVRTGSTVPDVPKAGNPNQQELKHLVNIEFDPETGRIFSAGIPSLVVFGDEGGDPDQLGFVSGTVEGLQVLDDGWVALSSRGVTKKNSEEIKRQGVSLVNTANPSQILKGSYTKFDSASGMAWQAPYLYVLTYEGELITFDVSSPPSLVEVSRTDGLGSPWELVIPDGEYAYVADNSLGVVVVDLGDPAAPVVGANVWAAGGAQDITHDGDQLYVAVGSAGVEVFDLADPTLPASLGATPTGVPAISVAAAEGYLWYATQQSIGVMDVTDPSEPVSLAVEDTDSWAMHVDTTGTTAYLADWQDVAVYELDDSARAPDADPSRDELYLVGSATELTMTIDNRGGADLVIDGVSSPDERVRIDIDTLVVAPGAAANVRVTLLEAIDPEADAEAEAEADTDPLDTTLCIATNDPDEPVLQLPLASTSSDSSVLIGEEAPDFNLPDLDGKYHQLSAQRGKPVVLVYFATW